MYSVFNFAYFAVISNSLLILLIVERVLRVESLLVARLQLMVAQTIVGRKRCCKFHSFIHS